MNLDESTSSVVGDSEAEDGLAQFIFSPHGLAGHKDEVKSTSIWSEKPEESAVLDSHVASEGSVTGLQVGSSNEAMTGGYRPYLRKRKAIQKLPYSLDRIKHRQLLQGIDVSSFDAVSEEVSLPTRPASVEVRDPEPVDDEWQNQYGDDSDAEDMATQKTDNGSQLPDSERNEEFSQKDRNHIRFRGKMIDVDRGYRGILPRMAWEKLMNKANRSKNKRRRVEEGDRKGLAKRKTLASVQNNQDVELMNDLIVPDDEVIEVDNVEVDDDTSRSAQFLDDANELQRMSAYYQDKYQDELSSTSSLEMNEAIFPDQELSGSLDEDYKKVATPKLEDLTEYIDVETGPDPSDGGGFAAKEDNSISIERMLMKRPAVSVSKKRNGTVKTRYRYDRSAKGGDKPKKGVKVARKSIRRGNSSKIVGINAFERKSQREGDITKSFQGSRGKQESSAQKKNKDSFYGILPNQLSDLSRPVNKFTTVVEGLSSHYAFSPTTPQVLNGDNTIYGQQSHELDGNSMCLSTAVNALLHNKDVEIPEIVKMKIGDKQFVLSKLTESDLIRAITEIFHHIMHHGITDTELVEVGESLTAFLLHLNNKGVYEPISKFHRDFRSKVNSLRQNAKPIHFYQIAVCQLMLLEVSKYTSVSSSFRNDIESEIVDHIVSFFKLLAICKDYLPKLDQHYLFKAYDVLAIVVRILDNKEQVWQRLENELFPPAIAFILIEVFPVRSTHWSIIKFGSDYDVMDQTLAFIRFCIEKYEWEVTSGVILSIERILRRRRFEDFPEEMEYSNLNSVTFSSEHLPVYGTIFNRYLSLLSSFKLTKAFIERIVPMGEISVSDTVSVLINRLNLLIFLAEHSDLNTEKKLGELLRPLVRNEYFASKDDKMIQRICQSVVNSMLSLLKIHSHKCVPFKGSIFVPLFDTFFGNNDTSKTIFIRFLERLNQDIESLNKSSSSFLRTIYPCFLALCEQQDRTKERQLMLHVYLKSLATLGPTWIHANLFQTVQKFVQKSTTWIEHYCAIGKFLIDNNVMTWWSFFVYNNVKSDLRGQLEFYQRLTQLCDTQSFEMIKRSLFETATASFFKEKSVLFAKFINTLIDRETGRKSALDLPSTIDSTLHLLKPFVSVLSKLSYDDLIVSLISEIRHLYQKNTIQKSYATQLIGFFNTHFVDQIKNSHDFLALKRELGISNEETDKSSFRDLLKLCADPISQACFIESGLIHATATADEISNYLGKLKSLFVFPVITSPFRFFVTLIEAHLVGDKEDGFLHIKIGIVAYYLRLLNEVLTARFQQVTEDEFLELCRLFKVMCPRLPYSPLTNIAGNRAYAYESVRFQIMTLGIAQGFSEFSMLVELSSAFLYNKTVPDGDDASSDLSREINQLVMKTAGQTLHVDFDEPQPEHLRLMAAVSPWRLPIWIPEES